MERSTIHHCQQSEHDRTLRSKSISTAGTQGRAYGNSVAEKKAMGVQSQTRGKAAITTRPGANHATKLRREDQEQRHNWPWRSSELKKQDKQKEIARARERRREQVVQNIAGRGCDTGRALDFVTDG